MPATEGNSSRSLGNSKTRIMIQYIVLLIIGLLTVVTTISYLLRYNINIEGDMMTSNIRKVSSEQTSNIRNISSEQIEVDTPILVRCSWGTSLIARDDHPKQTTSNMSSNFPIKMCSEDYCKDESSHEAYNDFLFNEAVSVESGYINKTQAFDRFLNSNSTCLFLEQHTNTLCTCEYYSFTEYCNRIYYNEKVEVSFIGDSTSKRFLRGVRGACSEIKPMPTIKPASLLENTKGQHIIVVNEQTLHKLYLPNSREEDIGKSMRGEVPISVNSFLNNIDIRLQHLLDKHSTTNDTIFVYMSNNNVCHDLYVDQYFESARFFYEDPNPKELETIMKRRGVDTVTTLGLTLDHYGSTFARKLANAHVKKHFPQYSILTLAAKYPANCILSDKEDGRHFPKPISGAYSFYVIKARLLLHLVIGRLHSNNRSSGNVSIQSSNTTNTKNKQVSTDSELPIYLFDTSTNTTRLARWGDIAPRWNRTTQYDDLFHISKVVESLPVASLKSKRRVVIIHCGPKLGSTTLRKACRKNFKDTCNVTIVGRGSSPAGYFNMTELYPYIKSCNNTHHYCTKQTTIPLDLPANNIDWIHMFPFRQYDEWAVSALKQQFDRGGEKACNNFQAGFLDTCKPFNMELDLRQYTKSDMSRFKDNVVERMNKHDEKHTILLYHHRDLDRIISLLSLYDDIPLLEGSDGKGKLNRKVGTCNASEQMLKQYHDCFSDELMELT